MSLLLLASPRVALTVRRVGRSREVQAEDGETVYGSRGNGLAGEGGTVEREDEEVEVGGGVE